MLAKDKGFIGLGFMLSVQILCFPACCRREAVVVLALQGRRLEP